jgi:hypothetical protein
MCALTSTIWANGRLWRHPDGAAPHSLGAGWTLCGLRQPCRSLRSIVPKGLEEVLRPVESAFAVLPRLQISENSGDVRTGSPDLQRRAG